MNKVIGFDLDGTLIDSLCIHYKFFIDVAKKFGIIITKEDIQHEQGLRPEIVLRDIKKDITDKEIKKIVEAYYIVLDKNLDSIEPFPDTVKTLSELRKKATLVLLSNGHFDRVLRLLEITKINPLFFDKIIGSDQVRNPKPAPDEILLAGHLEHHKLDYYVGDTIVDIKTSKNAGVKAIGITTGIGSREDLENEKPFKVIDNLSELLGIIE